MRMESRIFRIEDAGGFLSPTTVSKAGEIAGEPDVLAEGFVFGGEGAEVALDLDAVPEGGIYRR